MASSNTQLLIVALPDIHERRLAPKQTDTSSVTCGAMPRYAGPCASYIYLSMLHKFHSSLTRSLERLQDMSEGALAQPNRPFKPCRSRKLERDAALAPFILTVVVSEST